MYIEERMRLKTIQKLNKNANMQKLLKTALHALTSNDEILDSMEYIFIHNTILYIGWREKLHTIHRRYL